MTASFRIRTAFGVSVAAAALLVTALGLRAVIDSNPTTAHAGTIAGSTAAISVYDIQIRARDLPVQEINDLI